MLLKIQRKKRYNMKLDFFKQDYASLFSSKFIEQRYHLHISVGCLLGILFWFLTIEAYYTWQRLILTNLIVFMGAVGWEFVRGLLYGYPVDWADVRFGVYGSLIGSIAMALIIGMPK